MNSILVDPSYDHVLSSQPQNASLGGNLHDIEMRYNMELQKYNAVLLRLEAELTQIRSDIQHQTQDYQILFNINIQLEAEIAEYRRLLDGDLK